MKTAKTRMMAKVTLDGECRVIYHADNKLFYVQQRYFEPIDGKFKTRNIGKYDTLGIALLVLANIAVNLGQ